MLNPYLETWNLCSATLGRGGALPGLCSVEILAPSMRCGRLPSRSDVNTPTLNKNKDSDNVGKTCGSTRSTFPIHLPSLASMMRYTMHPSLRPQMSTYLVLRTSDYASIDPRQFQHSFASTPWNPMLVVTSVLVLLYCRFQLFVNGIAWNKNASYVQNEGIYIMRTSEDGINLEALHHCCIHSRPRGG